MHNQNIGPIQNPPNKGHKKIVPVLLFIKRLQHSIYYIRGVNIPLKEQEVPIFNFELHQINMYMILFVKLLEIF